MDITKEKELISMCVQQSYRTSPRFTRPILEMSTGIAYQD